MYRRLFRPLVSRLCTMRKLSRRSRRNRSRLLNPELLEPRQLLSVTPVLVADMNATPVSGVASPDVPLFGEVNGVTVFVEYHSDGSSRLVGKSLNFDESQVLQEFSQRTNLQGTSFTELHGVLYFHAEDSLSGDELWQTDGTAAGTWRSQSRSV
jgi:hypothetical protein